MTKGKVHVAGELGALKELGHRLSQLALGADIADDDDALASWLDGMDEVLDGAKERVRQLR